MLWEYIMVSYLEHLTLGWNSYNLGKYCSFGRRLGVFHLCLLEAWQFSYWVEGPQEKEGVWCDFSPSGSIISIYQCTFPKVLCIYYDDGPRIRSLVSDCEWGANEIIAFWIQLCWSSTTMLSMERGDHGRTLHILSETFEKRCLPIARLTPIFLHGWSMHFHSTIPSFCSTFISLLSGQSFRVCRSWYNRETSFPYHVSQLCYSS